MPGHPTFCVNCGRSFGVRICSRGHHNSRSAQFCAECGSSDLSTPAPPATLLHHLSGAVLYLFSAFVAVVAVGMVTLSAFYAVDWQELSGPLVELMLMLAFLYWTTTLLPGPIKKLGKAAGKQVMKSLDGKRKK
jgi:hypothetical protein